VENPRIVRLGNRFKEAGSSGRKAHVIFRNGKWAVFKEGTANAVAYPSKIRAVKEASRMVKNGKSERVVIHKSDGSVDKVHEVNP
jgi:hypothetical protein